MQERAQRTVRWAVKDFGGEGEAQYSLLLSSYHNRGELKPFLSIKQDINGQHHGKRRGRARFFVRSFSAGS